MAKEILCIPVGLQTREGVARVSRAQEEFDKAAGSLAGHSADFFARFGEDLATVKLPSNSAYWPLLQHALDLATTVLEAHDALARAIAGHPSLDLDKVAEGLLAKYREQNPDTETY